jgi:hypothetical protein
MAKEAILNTASGEPVTLSMPSDNIPESMGEDFSESVGGIISEWMGGFPRNQHPGASSPPRTFCSPGSRHSAAAP